MSRTTRSKRVRCLAALLVCCLAVLPAAQRSPAQDAKPGDRPPSGLPFPRSPADLDSFFESLFGATDEDRQALQAINVTAAEERELGAQMLDACLAEMKRRRIAVLTRGRDVAYLRKLVETLQPFLQNAERYGSIRVLVLDSPAFEARSFPGGTLLFSRGLLDFAGSEAALVGIVGHELAHLDRGHQLLPIRRLRLMRQLAPAGRRGFSPEAFLSTGQTLMRLSRPFRPEDERDADRDAVAWSHRAGYDPRALADLFERLDHRQQNPQLPIPAMFRSHPLNAERRRAVLGRADELQASDPQEDPYVGIENLKRRIPRSDQRFPE